MNKLLLVGVHPKGLDKPFHPLTKSGKVLRGILARNGISAKLINLWESAAEEKKGKVSAAKEKEIRDYAMHGLRLVALGRRAHSAMKRKFEGEVEYLPHPASWRKGDVERLEAGLRKLSK